MDPFFRGPQEAHIALSDQAEATRSLAGHTAEAFYAEVLQELQRIGTPYLVAGTYAVSAYTGIRRPTKDMDLFCKAGDWTRILDHFHTIGHRVEIEDERWIGKIWQDEMFFDIIFASSNGTMPVTQEWFQRAGEAEIFGMRVPIVGPTELICSKSFIQVRHRFDGADVVNLILKQHERIDWVRMLDLMEQHWEVLLTHLMNFRWVYPSERDRVPRWLMDELLDRLSHQLSLPPPEMKVCRGRLLSRSDYVEAVEEWGFGDIGGEGERRHG